MSKQKIEEVIGNAYVYVEGEQKLEELENALGFIAHLRANEIEIPDIDPAGEMFDLTYKGGHICTMELEAPGTGDTALVTFINIPGEWTKADAQADERLKHATWENLRGCRQDECGGDCNPGSTLTVFGKTFSNICSGSSIMFDNPSDDSLECAKNMIDARVKEIK